ncbi:MAG: glycosyltransferase family 4 protein [Puniceicoccaceae bacterium]
MTKTAPSAPRVALVTDLFPPVVGGAETHARDLAVALAGAGAKVTVLTRLAGKGLPPREVLAPGAEVVRTGSPGSPRWGKYGFVPALLREWRRRSGEFDVACLCGFRVLGWPLARAAARTGTPLVLRAEVLGEMSGGFIWKKPERGESRLLRLLFRPVIAARNRRLIRDGWFLAISGAVEEEYSAAGVPPERVRRIPNGVDTDRFHPPEPGERERLRREFGFGEEPVFLYSGKLNRGKGLGDLLAAWEAFRAEGGPGRLVLVGSGGGQFLSIEEELRGRAGDPASGVTFTGYRDDVGRWLRAADVFVFPSEAESFGLAPLEANASGLPVICTPAGALAETVPDGIAGIRVPVGDPGAIRRAMAELAADPDRRRAIGRRARERVVAEYSFAAVARAYLDWFAELAGGAGR